MIKNICIAFIVVSTGAGCAPKAKQTEIVNLRLQNKTFFVNEIKPLQNKPCFEGAYYRKLVSSTDHWAGITGIVILPEIEFDEDRKHPKKPLQYMDNPSIYLGGNMDEQETDIGLTWEVVKDEKGNVSKERKAFRPFLRRNEFKEEQKAIFENAPAKADYYWYPGEEVKMSVKLIADKTLRFTVEGAGKKFERDFICNGFVWGKKGDFKRVNAIDQVGNEGTPVKPTKTKVLNAVWKETSLFRNVNGNIVAVPFHSGRYTEMLCPAKKFFKVGGTGEELSNGAESLTISGSTVF